MEGYYTTYVMLTQDGWVDKFESEFWFLTLDRPKKEFFSNVQPERKLQKELKIN